MVPLVACMCVATVWGRYHYVVDVFGGMVTGTLGYVIGNWIMKTQGAGSNGRTLNRRRAILYLRTLEDFGNAQQDSLARDSAMNCKPIGNPEDEKPQGTEMAGTPARLAGRLWRKRIARVDSHAFRGGRIPDQ